MTIVASGPSLGAVIHPITLNNTFHSLGFANALPLDAHTISTDNSTYTILEVFTTIRSR
ncbi:hypothetical protein DFH09DRAFT_1331325 [Mycena vulgaris]|nr:hypothetical protein DFH09DRAFT_1331325 [Mycena vulgaris]